MRDKELKALQAPLKQLYRDEPARAHLTLRARGELALADGPVCQVATHLGILPAGLHPAAGGDGSHACAGTILLEALVACAGVTLAAVATSLGIQIDRGQVWAEGDLDMRGTLGIDRSVPVGFTSIRLGFDLDTPATDEQKNHLITLTERYCVVYQSLKNPPPISTGLGPAFPD